MLSVSDRIKKKGPLRLGSPPICASRRGRGAGVDEQQFDSHVFVLSLRCLECNSRWDDRSSAGESVSHQITHQSLPRTVRIARVANSTTNAGLLQIEPAAAAYGNC